MDDLLYNSCVRYFTALGNYGFKNDEEVKKLLKVSDTQTVREFSVDGSDISKYIDGDPNSRMFSSAK